MNKIEPINLERLSKDLGSKGYCVLHTKESTHVFLLTSALSLDAAQGYSFYTIQHIFTPPCSFDRSKLCIMFRGVSLHSRGMTYDEMISFLIENKVKRAYELSVEIERYRAFRTWSTIGSMIF